MSTKWMVWLDSGGIKGRLLSGIKWNMLEAGITAASNFVAAIAAARLLGLDDFGAFSIIRSTVYMMASVAGLSLGITATKYVAELRTTDRPRLGSILGLCLLIAGGTSLFFCGTLLIFAPQIAVDHLGAPQITEQLRLAAVYIFFVTINGYQVGALVGFEAFAKLAKINMIQGILSVAVTFLFTWLGGLTGASLALGLLSFFNWFLHHRAIGEELGRHETKICYTGLWRERKTVTSFALPAALAGVIGAMVVWYCNAFLVRQLDGLAQMAIFTAANQFRSLIMFVPGLVTRVASPILCNLVGEKENATFSRVFWFNVAVAVGASTLVAVFLTAAAPYLLTLFGKGFAVGRSVLTVVAGMAVIEVVANTFYQPLFAHGKLWWQVGIIVCWSLVLVVTTLTSVGDYGALGLAYAYLAAHLVSAGLYILANSKMKPVAADQRTDV